MQTVIRRFGRKEALLVAAHEHFSEEILRSERFAVPRGNVGAGLKSLVDNYEKDGDIFIRLLAQEPRYPLLTRLLDRGRREHRQWVANLFAPWLEPLPPSRRERRLTALIAACDIYNWKLLRRDLRRTPADTLAVMHETVLALIAPASPAAAASVPDDRRNDHEAG